MPDAAEHLRRGQGYARRHEYEPRLLHLGRAIDLAPDNAEAHAQRGSIHVATGNLDAALADFNEALAAAADMPRSITTAAWPMHSAASSRRPSPTLARRSAWSPMRRWPTRAAAVPTATWAGSTRRLPTSRKPSASIRPCEAYVRRGLARAAAGDIEEAIADFAEAVRRRPQYRAACSTAVAPAWSWATTSALPPTSPPCCGWIPTCRGASPARQGVRPG